MILQGCQLHDSMSGEQGVTNGDNGKHPSRISERIPTRWPGKHGRHAASHHV